MKMSKVYCEDCVYSFYNIDPLHLDMTMRTKDCGHGVEIVDTPMTQERRYASILVKNTDNHCQYFSSVLPKLKGKKRGWFDKILDIIQFKYG